MDSLPVVVLVDSNSVVKERIRKILSDQDITIYEASSRQDLLGIMEQNKNQINLIVTDIEIDTDRNFDGISLIQMVKNKSDTIPVVVVTSESRKDIITRYLREGTADYILKPFEDNYLKEKLLKHINVESLTEFTVLKFSLKNYLEHEIYKAKKGNYSFTLLKISFQLNSQAAEASNEFYKHAKAVYREIKSLFWDSDLYIQHGYHSHLGFFPFCTEENSKVISDKIIRKYEEFKLADPAMQNYVINQTYSTYPIDGETPADLLEALEARNTETIKPKFTSESVEPADR
ncbi:PleD family two-component system response regulator [Acetobacterium sp.]|uniref:response regulator n=1 Tax=Acetobacterium sp. TaxID=1872094 RepID=UPI0035943241